ncbi:hypothetical protein [Kitasatospora sp. NRRL B-11411]|uniref:hypothetical protein n=1 Tax=Kitasatospora sp. NRRL B-11411 TaxID=1463822 RepID=UPI0004C2E5CF|nr:hypothetical protein [Kitasatospora sp. NRRL B-11411]
MNALTAPVPGNQAAATVANTGIPVLLLANHPGPAVIAASADGDPCRHTATTAAYADGLCAEAHAAGSPDPEELVRQVLFGGERVGDSWLAASGRATTGCEVCYDGLVACSGIWQGWTLLTVTPDTSGGGQLPALRLVGANSLPEGPSGCRVPSSVAAGQAVSSGQVTA